MSARSPSSLGWTDTERPHFSAEGLEKTFRGSGRSVSALRSLTLSIAQGERVAIIGPSGSGKTTLIRLLSLAIPLSAGQLWVDGHPAQGLRQTALRRLRCDLGVIYQQHHLVRRLTVFHNVLAGRLGRWSFLHAARALARPTAADWQLALAALEQVDLAEKALERPTALSGGQQQRVAIARVLAQAPRAILADEPVSSLDPGLACEIIELLVRASQQSHTTLIASLHNVELALNHFQRVIGLREGQVCFDCPPAQVASSQLQSLYARTNNHRESAK